MVFLDKAHSTHLHGSMRSIEPYTPKSPGYTVHHIKNADLLGGSFLTIKQPVGRVET